MNQAPNPTSAQLQQTALDFYAQMTEDYANSLPPLAAQCVRVISMQQGKQLAEALPASAVAEAPKRTSALASTSVPPSE
jgi:hypothetical protein